MSRVEIPIFQDPISNPCLDQCPQSSCCRDMHFLYLTPNELSKFIQNNNYSKEFDSEMDIPLKGKFDFLRNGVYFAKRTSGDNYRALIAGPCPNLDENGECTIYEERPIPCSRFEVGSKNCNSARNRDRLQTLKIA